MSKFVDAQKRDWTVRITGATISEAAGRGIDINLGMLAKAAEGNILEVLGLRMLGQFIDLCYLGCKHNARMAAGKVSEEAFKEAITGPTTLPALVATVEALCECFGVELEAVPADPTAAGGAAKAAEAPGQN